MRVTSVFQHSQHVFCSMPILWLLLPFIFMALVQAKDAGAKDTVPPIAHWISPRANVTLQGKVKLAVKATDNKEVDKVIFYLGIPLGEEDEKKIYNQYADLADGGGFGEVYGGVIELLYDIQRQGLQKNAYLPPVHIIGEDVESADGWSITVDFSRYLSGKYTIVAKVLDAAGNAMCVALPVNITSSALPPKVTLSPEVSCNEEGLIVRGTVSYNHTLREEMNVLGYPNEPGIGTQFIGNVILVVDNRLAGVGTFTKESRNHKGGAWEGKIFGYFFQPGEHTVTAIGLDAYGNGGAAWQKYTVPLQNAFLEVDIKETREKTKTLELTGIAFGGIKVEYRFWEKEKDTWVVIRDYAPNNRCTLQPLPPNNSQFKVEVREVGTTRVVSSEEQSFAVVADTQSEADGD